MRYLRSWALYLLRAVGGFALAQHLTRRQLRILCYHGFAIGDEYRLAPVMFMRASTFERRLRILRRRRMPVLPLDEAVRRLRRGEIAHAETVITLDDGWASNLSIGAPLLERYGYPATIYVSTEHLEAGTEAFNVALGYMIRRSGRELLTLSGLHPQIDGTYAIGADADAAIVELIERAERALPLAERQQLLRPIARALGVDAEEVLRDGRFRLLSSAQLLEAFGRGLDIQMHTHTHRLPDTDFDAMAHEVNHNRSIIAQVVGVEPRHFCYPSGVYRGRQPDWLQQLGIASATTCEPGLNDADRPVMLLNRFLDSDARSDIEFEAMVCGVHELTRRLRRRRAPAEPPPALSESDSR